MSVLQHKRKIRDTKKKKHTEHSQRFSHFTSFSLKKKVIHFAMHMNLLNQLIQLLLSLTTSTEILVKFCIHLNSLNPPPEYIQPFKYFLYFRLGDVAVYSGEMTANRSADMISQNS